MNANKRKALLALLDAVEQWNKAYPLGIFPEPDMDKAHKVLKENDMTLDEVAASCMRHVVTQLHEVYNEGLNGEL